MQPPMPPRHHHRTDRILDLLEKHQLTLADLQTVVAASGRDPAQWTSQLAVLTRVWGASDHGVHHMFHPTTEQLLLDNPKSHMPPNKDEAPSPRRATSIASQQSASLAAALHIDPPEPDSPLVLSRSRSSTPRGQSTDAGDAAANAVAATMATPAKATQEFVSALRAAAVAAGMPPAATPPRGGSAGASAGPSAGPGPATPAAPPHSAPRPPRCALHASF